MEKASLSGTLFKFLISFFLLDIPTRASGSFLVLGPTAPVQTSVEGEAVLSCHLSPAQSAWQMQIVWSKSKETVYHYQKGEDYLEDQSPNYKGRTELVKDAITSGNVTLKIWHVTPSDAGWYTCFFNDSSHSEEAFVELKVIEPPSLLESYPIWWSVIGILALGQLGILFYYSWKTYQLREHFLVSWTHKAGVVILAVFWCLLMSFLIFYIVNMSGCRGMEDLDEWVQKDQVYLALLTFLPLLPTLLFVAVDFHGKFKEKGNDAQNQAGEPSGENIALNSQS